MTLELPKRIPMTYTTFLYHRPIGNVKSLAMALQIYTESKGFVNILAFTRVLPCFRHLILRRKKWVVNSCWWSVSKSGQAKQFDLWESKSAGITRAVQAQADSRRHLCFHKLNLNVGEATCDDWCGQWQHVDAICTYFHRDWRWTSLKCQK